MSAVAPTLRSPRAAPRRLLRLRSDTALGERFAVGDEAAFAVLYERHRASVLAVCIGVLGCRHDAEDAAQEAFAALAVELRRSPPRELRAWLIRVARNAAIDVARRRRAKPLPGDAEAQPGTAGGGISTELDAVLAGIRQLPEGQRTALLMRELAGHSYEEIANMLQTDEEGVRGLIARARIGLRNYREASELPCASVRAALAAERDGRRRETSVRRHVRGCASCQAYRQALRSDAKALRALAPTPAAGVASGGAAVGLAAKGALAGGALSQAGAVCAVSVCSVGGLVLLTHHPLVHHGHRSPARHARRSAAPRPRASTREVVRGQRVTAAIPAAARPAGSIAGRPVGGTVSWTRRPVSGTHGSAGATLRLSFRAGGVARSTPRGAGTGSRAPPAAAATGGARAAPDRRGAGVRWFRGRRLRERGRRLSA